MFFDARFILSGSVLHSTSFRTHPSRASGDARLRQTAFRYSAHRPSQTRRAESLRWHSAPCCAGPIRSRGFSSCVAAAGFPRSLPSQYCLVSLNRSNPSASTPSLKPLPPARLSRPKCVAVHPDSTFRVRAGKIVISRPNHHTVRLLPRLSACLLTLRKTEKRCFASPFQTSYESSGGIFARSKVCA